MLHPKLRRLHPRPFRRGKGWGEGLLGVVYPAVLAVSRRRTAPTRATCLRYRRRKPIQFLFHRPGGAGADCCHAPGYGEDPDTGQVWLRPHP